MTTTPQPSLGVQLLASGATVTLKDGREYRIVLDFEAAIKVEEELGSLGALIDALLANGFRLRRLRQIRAGLLAALSHYAAPDAPDAELRSRSADDWTALFDLPALEDYTAALLVAFLEAMPKPAPGEGEPRRSARRGSRGRATTTSPPSAGGEATVSGAA